jgi:hypothetical protein
MNSRNEPRLGGFEARLLSELRDFVQLRAESSPGPLVPAGGHTGTKPRQGLRARLPPLLGMQPRRSLAAAVAVIAGCVAVLIGASSGASPSAALAKEFPVFKQPAIAGRKLLASILREQGALPRNVRVDLRSARAIHTPYGTGYVMTDRGANLMCVAVPGGHGWGADCGSVHASLTYGAGGLQTYPTAHSAELVYVLPAGATATARAAGGKTRALALPNGVLAIVVHHLTFITIHIARHANITALATPSECDPITRTGPACKALAAFDTKHTAAPRTR